jgi:hypothetical protein
MKPGTRLWQISIKSSKMMKRKKVRTVTDRAREGRQQQTPRKRHC